MTEAHGDQTPESGDVIPATLSAARARQVIRDLAANPDNIIPVGHAKKRLQQRKISMTQVRRVVQAGFIDGDPWRDELANWRVTMRGFSAGAQLTIGVAIDWKTRILVITAF